MEIGVVQNSVDKQAIGGAYAEAVKGQLSSDCVPSMGAASLMMAISTTSRTIPGTRAFAREAEGRVKADPEAPRTHALDRMALLRTVLHIPGDCRARVTGGSRRTPSVGAAGLQGDRA